LVRLCLIVKDVVVMLRIIEYKRAIDVELVVIGFEIVPGFSGWTLLAS